MNNEMIGFFVLICKDKIEISINEFRMVKGEGCGVYVLPQFAVENFRFTILTSKKETFLSFRPVKVKEGNCGGILSIDKRS